MSAIDPSILQMGGAGASSTPKKAAPPQTLSQNDFLKLMTSQLKAQDPLKPLDNSQFVSQMAQFSTVSGIQSLQDSFSKLAASLSSTNMLQGASLVGRDVLVPSNTAVLGASGGVNGAVDLPASGTLVVEVTDSAGQVLRHMELGSQPAGLARFNWDGNDNTGTRLAAGSYRINARVVNGQDTQAATSYVVGHVNSVATDSNNGLTVDVQGLGTVSLGNIRQIL